MLAGESKHNMSNNMKMSQLLAQSVRRHISTGSQKLKLSALTSFHSDKLVFPQATIRHWRY